MLANLEWKELLPIGFVLLGITLFFAALYQRHQAQKLKKILNELYQLNQQASHDALTFLNQVWPILQKYGFKSLTIDLSWYDEPYHQHFGENGPQTYHIPLKEGAIQGDITLTTAPLRNEEKLCAETVVQTLQMIIQSNISAQVAQVLLSQKRLEDYQLFIQHDTKNLAQFIELLSSLVKNADTDSAKIKLVERLKNMLPAILHRAQRITSPVRSTGAHLLQQTPIALADFIQHHCQALELECQIKGDIHLQAPKELLEVVFQNVLDNFKRHTQNPTVNIEIESTEGQVLIKFMQNQPFTQKVESFRMFQPFWTTSESGLGLGLFIARESLKKINGSIEFITQGSMQGFQIQIPKKISL
ncbi:ATP-binding protein [Galenea microaerophila]